MNRELLTKQGCGYIDVVSNQPPGQLSLAIHQRVGAVLYGHTH